MRATSCVLAFATLVATLWTGTVAGNLEEVLQKFLTKHCNDTNCGIPAKLINNNRPDGLIYQKAGHSDKNVVDLLLKEIPPYPPGANPHMICEYDLGIEVIGDGSVFCSPHTISLEVYNDDEGERQMRYIVHFQSDNSTGLLKLYVPVFEIPFQHVSHLGKLCQWTKLNGVELVSPLNEAHLKSLAADQTILVHFGWLERLLVHGIYGTEESASKQFSAWTRPVVMRSGFINEFVEVWNQFKGNEEGRNTPEIRIREINDLMTSARLG